MRRTSQFVITGLVLLMFMGRQGWAQSMQIYPGSSRANNTVYCIGSELNPVLFVLLGDKAGETGIPGKFLIPGIGEGDVDEPIVLQIDLPAGVQWVGANTRHAGSTFLPDTDDGAVEHDGVEYSRRTVTLDSKLVNSSIVKRAGYYEVRPWLRLPEQLKAKFYWRLIKGDRILAEDCTGIETVGTAPAHPVLAQRFINFPWGPEPLPKELRKERAEFYKRIGITDLNVLYGAGGWSEDTADYVKTLREAGIRVVAERGASYMELTHGTSHSQGLYRPKTWQERGLAACINELCERIESSPYPDDLAAVADQIDGVLWDYEPGGGAGRFPGYDEPITIRDFCKEAGLGELTAEQVKAEHAQEYFQYRQQLMGKPAVAFAEMVHKVVGPDAIVWLNQGNHGMEQQIAFDTYLDAVDYIMPMIYIPALPTYDWMSHTAANPAYRQKLVTVFSPNNPFMMKTEPAGRVMLDYIGSASLGCPGAGFWPGPRYADGEIFFENYKAAHMLAPVEDFYIDGELSDEIICMGLPYLERRVDVGTRTLDLSQPNWRQFLVCNTRMLDGRALITLLNYHANEEAFVELKWLSAKAPQYVINPSEGIYLTVKGNPLLSAEQLNSGVLVRVPAFYPALWLIGGDKSDIEGLRPLPMERLRREFEYKKKTAADQAQDSEAPLGKKGDLAIRYAEVGNDKQGRHVCLEVTSPAQSLAFSHSGGRIWKWEAGGDEWVTRHFEQGGMGMDLMYLPIAARWSGEQTTDMVMTKVMNTGKEVQVAYQGFIESLSVSVEKVYTIPAEGSQVEVDIRLTNRGSDSSTISYWSHNSLDGGDAGSMPPALLVDRGEKVERFPNENYTFSNLRQGDKYADILLVSMLKGAAGPVFGVYYPSRRAGMLLRAPDDFMQLYRSRGQGGSLEWMSKPMTLSPGQTVEFSYEMEIRQAADVQAFEKQFKP